MDKSKAHGEWIEHDGKGMPVDGHTMVHIKLGSGLCDENLKPERASWWHYGDGPGESNWIADEDYLSTITHYRIVKETPDA